MAGRNLKAVEEDLLNKHNASRAGERLLVSGALGVVGHVQRVVFTIFVVYTSPKVEPRGLIAAVLLLSAGQSCRLCLPADPESTTRIGIIRIRIVLLHVTWHFMGLLVFCGVRGA